MRIEEQMDAAYSAAWGQLTESGRQAVERMFRASSPFAPPVSAAGLASTPTLRHRIQQTLTALCGLARHPGATH